MIAALMLAALGAGTLFPAAGTYRYSAAMNGQNVGAWSVTVRDATGGIEVDEDSTASVMGMQLAAKATLLLGPDLAPTKYDGNYRTPGQNPIVSVSLSPSTATVSGAFTSAPQSIALLASTRHFVVVEPGLLAGLFVLPAQLGSWKESAVTWITPATAQAQSLTIGSQTPSRPADVPPADSAISIERPVALTMWYDPATMVPDEILVPSQNAVLKRQRS
jgi:hypothetical protein